MRLQVLALVVFAAFGATVPRAQVVISEIMADNRDAWFDEDGAAKDWVELYNASSSPVGVAGLYLTDSAKSPARWKLPPVAIAGRGFLVVCCSGKNRREPGRPLHTDFKLGRKKGAVFLVARDGETVLSELRYRRQQSNRSFGVPQPYQTIALLPRDGEARYLVADASLARLPRGADFDDSAWAVGKGGFGFDVGSQDRLGDLLGTDVESAMRGRGTSIYYRFAFEVVDPTVFDLVELRLQFDAGCVAYLNGREVARFRAPESVEHDSVAEVGVEVPDPLRVERVLLDAPETKLVAGRNVLAIQGLTPTKFAMRHFLQAEVLGHACGAPEGVDGVFLDEPSPGRPNGAGRTGFVKTPRIEPAGALLSEPIRVQVDGRGDGVVVRYTTDGSIPTERSAVCDGVVEIGRTCELKLRGFADGQQPSEVATAAFTKLGADVVDFSSNLPLVVVTSFGRAIYPKTSIDAHAHIVGIAARDGRSRLQGEPDFSGLAGIKQRGSSSLERPKKGYGLELRDLVGDDQAAELLGMPADADWVLYGPHNWDLAHLRNPLCYELARRIGLDAPRTRFIELFVNDAADDLTRSDYVGLYVLIEKIGRGDHRVAIEELKHTDDREPDITGGYILKIDRPGPGDMGFEAKGQRVQYVEPKERDITDAQRAWLKQHFERFGAVLESDEFADEESGYPAWIDRANWIDYHLFNEYVKNPDAYTLSTYFYKDRGGKIRMGPVWDYDRGIRTNDKDYWVGRPSRPTGWTGDCYYSWWGVLFRDPEFRRRYRARGRELLATVWSDENVFALVDEMAATIAEAEERDRQRWPILRAGEWFDEILDIKDWVEERGAWFRDELLEVPEFEVSDEQLQMPFTVSLSCADPAGKIYYTTDGAAPRLKDGTVSPRARLYDGPIPVASDTQVRARIKVGETWSREVDRWYASEVVRLAITEVMYNPRGGRDYEFVELINFGDTPIDLTGIDLRGAIRFHFGLGTLRTLPPGERVVVVRDMVKFAERYDVTKIRIAGTFMGRFSNTGAELRVLGSVGQELARIEYEDDWYPRTDGEGRSLVAEQIERVVTEEKQWRESSDVYGTPGR